MNPPLPPIPQTLFVNNKEVRVFDSHWSPHGYTEVILGTTCPAFSLRLPNPFFLQPHLSVRTAGSLVSHAKQPEV